MGATAQSRDAPWEVASQIRRAIGKIDRTLYREQTEERRARVDAALQTARTAYQGGLHSAFKELTPEIDTMIGVQFDQLENGARLWSGAEVAWAQNRIWTGLLTGAYQQTIAALATGDLENARLWLGLREYARKTGDAAAGLAVAALAQGDISPVEAKRIVESELLTIYAGEMRRALVEAEKAAQSGYLTQMSGFVGRAQGFFQLLADNMDARLGQEERTKLDNLFARLETARSSGDAKGVIETVAELKQALVAYSPVSLSRDEIERQARLMMRFLNIVHVEYGLGVHDGVVIIPVEYREAVMFRDQAEAILATLQGEIQRISTDNFSALRKTLSDLQKALEAKADPKTVERLALNAHSIVEKVFAIKDDGRSFETSFQILPSILDEIVILARSGDYTGASMKQLEAYSYFDPDIEQRLVPRSPTLALKLENLFWEGSAEHHGLANLIADQAPPDAIKQASDELKTLLEQAHVVLNAKLSATGAFLQALAIVLREGLEAIIVIAALMGALKAAGAKGYKPYLWSGVVAALALSFGIWWAAGKFLTISTSNRELMEGLTALFAAAVLIYVTHWIFHKAYVVDWVTFIKNKVQDTASAGRLLAIASLGFFVVFREGFETVLFFEALMIDTSPAPVLGGFVAGVIGSIGIAVGLLYLGLKLPLGTFFKVTGFLLMALAIIFTGAGIRGLQTANLISATPVPGFPEWPFLQLYLGIYPVAEPLIAQAFVLVLFMGGLFWVKSQAKIESKTV
jgi:high-affinity iron transporter